MRRLVGGGVGLSAGARAGALEDHDAGRDVWRWLNCSSLACTDAFYPTWALDLARDIVGMLRKEIAALHAEGAAYIQLDSLHYVERGRRHDDLARMLADGDDPDTYLDDLSSPSTMPHSRGPTTTV